MNKLALPKIGILTVSDRASRGEYEDRGGPAVEQYLQKVLVTEFESITKIVSDDRPLIEAALIEMCDVQNCGLVVTTGGTGPAMRDVTPEATEAVCTKLMPGFGELMRTVSLRQVPTAILSRQIAGIRFTQETGTLVVNLPGSPKAVSECLDAIFPAIPYCLDLIGAAFIETDPVHVSAFRPKKK